MSLLLFRYKLYLFAVSIDLIKRISAEKLVGEIDMVYKERFLFDNRNSPLFVNLKTERIIPAEEVIGIVTDAFPDDCINPFLRGCMLKELISAFFTYQGRIYGVLKESFLSGGINNGNSKLL